VSQVAARIGWIDCYRFRGEVISGSGIIVSIPVFKEIRFRVEILSDEAEGCPERRGASLVALILVGLCRQSFVWESWCLAAAAVESA